MLLDEAETLAKKGEQLHNIEGLDMHKDTKVLAKQRDQSNTVSQEKTKKGLGATKNSTTHHNK